MLLERLDEMVGGPKLDGWHGQFGGRRRTGGGFGHRRAWVFSGPCRPNSSHLRFTWQFCPVRTDAILVRLAGGNKFGKARVPAPVAQDMQLCLASKMGGAAGRGEGREGCSKNCFACFAGTLQSPAPWVFLEMDLFGF